jgi:Zn-dependent protease
MSQLLFSWETLAVAVLLAAAIWWAARPVQRLRTRMQVRAFREDIWRTMVMERGIAVYVDFIERYDFDEGSDADGVMVLKNGTRFRFETAERSKDGDVWRGVWRSVEIDPHGKPCGDLYETVMRLSEAPDGSLLDLDYIFYKGDTGGVKVWLGRLFRPLTRLSAGPILRGMLEKSGAYVRYNAVHGPAPRPATVGGVAMTRTSLILFIVGAASFIWLSGVWEGVAILAILVLHELGHVLAMRAYGDRASVFYLVPFMGGVAIGQKPPPSDWHLILMVLAGPFAGLLTAAGAIGLFHWTDNDWFAAVAMLAAIINLLNLAPIPFLDGGQVLMALLRLYLPNTTIHWVGIVLMLAGAAAFAWLGSSLMMVVFGLLAALQAAFPTPASANRRTPLSHTGAVIGFVLLISLAAALLGLAWLVANGDAYPANPLRLMGLGPFT